MSIGNFNIRGLMSASAQMERLAQVIRDGREGAQLSFASEVERNAGLKRAQVAPPLPTEGVLRTEEDQSNRHGDVFQEKKDAEARLKDKQTDNDDIEDKPDHLIDIVV